MAQTKQKIAGIDYIRLTCADHRLYGYWEEELIPEHMQAAKEGARLQQGWVLGYYGPKTQHSFLGKRDDGCMVQCSSYLADRMWRLLVKPEAKCTRVDVQQTIDMSPKHWEMVEATYQEVVLRKTIRGTLPQAQMLIRPTGAVMCTVGSRQSEAYGRCYDKERESGTAEYQGMVRWEVEYKGDKAVAAFNEIRGHDGTRSYIASLVHAQWAQWGCQLLREGDETFVQPPDEKRAKTFETALAWIAAQVSPTIERLIEAGKHEELAAALLTFMKQDATIGAELSQLRRQLERLARRNENDPDPAADL